MGGPGSGGSNRKLEVNYNPPRTLKRFMRSEGFYRGVSGPVGSGKSTGCCWELMRRGQGQVGNGDGVRKTRMVVVRQTYRELLDTTIKTWQDWFPVEVFGDIQKTTMSQLVKFILPDKSRVEMEVLFRALDRQDDIKKLLSLELTGAWVNEAREVPKGIIDALGDRVGRYPAMKDGGCTWRGVIMDTNMPDSDHWWYRLAEVVRPKGWEFWRQPGGLKEVAPGVFEGNSEAENLENLEAGYYETRMEGKSPDYVRVYYCAQYGFVQEGKPVVHEYVDQVHCAGEILKPIEGLVIYVGLDFGLTPAAVMGQKLANGRWLWLDELVTEDMGTVRFGEVLKSKLLGEYGGYKFEIWGDPSGDYRAQTDERTPFQILKAMGIDVRPAPSNDPVLRREAIAVPLGRLLDGKPGLMLSPKCAVTREGLAGRYYYKRVQVSNEERFMDKPVKNRYSHPVDAAGYMMLGAGEGMALLMGRRDDASLSKMWRQGRHDYAGNGAWMVV